ncbi:LacI family kdg operon repressor [Weissella uvarum]|uniref:LacI family DNA-binding transcriptional regulator n=1 Tax=Weissella uvarum TaxID=1479233 RepID=UPI001960838A|nr:LacI family DNA-binding transcriptional regulator [Weissella uvarum]MBM7616704.1 LacI family kdg operon repressor [Weissella uvarum]MCM0594841.1 LacI family DNA-binding transcriptional regulator [Weissella uvarum]
MTKVTITDVANEVGISKTTVSRYLNGQFDRINVKTQAAIQEAIDRLGYVPNQQARSLKLKESKLIGLVVADMANVYSSYLISGIQAVLREQGYSLMMFDSANQLTQEKHAIQQVMAANVDGLILQPLAQTSDHYQFLIETSLPVVLVDRQTTPAIWPSVTSDNYNASHNMAELLQKRHYNHIIFLDTAGENPWSNKLRYDGVSSVSKAHQMDLTYLQINDHDYHPLLTQLTHTTQDVPAIFAANGEILTACLRWLKDQQFKIPVDVGIAGYDDSTLGELFNPGITAIEQNPQLIGRTTAELLLKRLKEATGDLEQIEIPSQLVERASI